MSNLVGLKRLKCLELSDTEIGSNGLHHLSGKAFTNHFQIFITSITGINQSHTFQNSRRVDKSGEHKFVIHGHNRWRSEKIIWT